MGLGLAPRDRLSQPFVGVRSIRSRPRGSPEIPVVEVRATMRRHSGSPQPIARRAKADRAQESCVGCGKCPTAVRGETVVITRHGRAIARIVPEAHRRQAEIDKAIENIKALRQRTGKIPLDELLSARHEGHKY